MFQLNPDALSLEEFQIGAGPEDRPVQAVGKGVVTLGAEPKFNIALSARQIDVDRSIGGGPEDPVSIEAALNRFIASLDDLPVPPIGGLLTIDAQGLVVGGSVIQAVGADLSPAADGWDVQVASALLPGNTRIDVSGKLTLGRKQGFAGTAKLNSRRPSAFAGWLRGGPRAAGRLDAFSVATRLNIAADIAAFEDIDATLGDDAVSGAVRLHYFPVSGDRFANVDLSAQTLDLDQARSLIELFAADWLSAGGATRVALDLKAGRLVAGGVAAQNVVLDGVLADNSLALAKLFVGDLAGARIAARGRITDPLGDASGQLDASLSATDLTGAVRFLTSLLPDSDLVSRFARVAPLISPVEAELAVSAGAGEASMSAGLTGSFAATRINFNASGTGTLADPASLAGRADLSIAGADTAIVLSQLGLDIVPFSATGPARLTMAVEGGLAEGAQVRIDGEGAGMSLTVAGDARLAGKQLSFAGDLGLIGLDIDPALSLAGIAVPGIGTGHALLLNGPVWLDGRILSLELDEAAFDGDPVTGAIKVRLGDEISVTGPLGLSSVSMPVLLSAATGQDLSRPEDLRSETGFAASIPAGLGLNLDISASTLDLGVPQVARNAEFRFGFADGGVRIDGLSADFAGGKLRASAAALPQDAGLNFRLRAALSGARLEEIAWRARDRAVAQGELDLSFAVEGAGRAPAGIVSTLGGSGTFTLADGFARFINPQAFGSIIRAADAGLKLDPDAVRTVFAAHLDAGTLAFERGTGSFAVNSGIMRVSTLSLDTSSATVLGSATIDLNTFQLSSDWSMSVDPGEDKVTGAEPEVGMLFSGP
ncbi:MAG: AsmA-like C-terminal region-containing protein, partial [Hyphomicrobiales bacterium]|nr:AsmA-like C-terminal region-containing protein [Hyphomicrobiales bacterium]